jgi:pimeloyl-ACP methyl ester carboxylesterase
MSLRPDAAPPSRQNDGHGVLLVMVPGMGMCAADFHAQGLIAAIQRRGWPVTIATVDPEPDAYLDGSVEARLLREIAQAQRAAGTSRIWLAGISLGCQAILRCVRAQPGVAEGLLLLTPYLASTGLIAEVGRSGGLRTWAAANRRRTEPDRAFLSWLATTPPANLPRMLIGRALDDRFATTSEILAALLPAGRVVQVAGAHDWTSWGLIWRLMLDQDPFAQVEVPTS